jgi:hypothetical protein
MIIKFTCAHAREHLTDMVIISSFFNTRDEYLEKSALEMYQSIPIAFNFRDSRTSKSV